MIEQIEIPEELLNQIEALSESRNLAFNDMLIELLTNSLQVYRDCAEIVVANICTSMQSDISKVKQIDKDKAIQYLMNTKTVHKMVENWTANSLKSIKV